MRITVFTPTYNRAYTLPRLFESLKEQTYHSFEWVIVDDGSTDNTQELVESFISASPFFQIKYKKTENGGKHRAINRGMPLVSGELMLLMDSDDWLREDALEWIEKIEKTIPDSEKENFAGVQGLCAHANGEIVGKTFDGVMLDTTTIDRSKHNITGDKCEVYYTEVMRRYPFPEFEGEKFLTEAIVWDRMAADGLKIRFFNEGIYFCEYLDDGLTHSGNMLYARNPKQWGLFIYYNYLYKKEDLFHTTLKVYTYYLYETDLNMSIREMADNLRFSKAFIILSIVIQSIADKTRYFLHNKSTIKHFVEEDKVNSINRDKDIVPKIIHYCWFGGASKPELVQKCMKSWETYCDGWQIIEWNENTFDLNCCEYVKQAYEKKKWAFVSDYARLYALYHYGGIYLDTDVELLKPLNCFLHYDAFTGFEDKDHPITAIMGAKKNYSLFQVFLQEYKTTPFVFENGELNLFTNTNRITEHLKKKGVKLDDSLQTVDSLTIFPHDFFCPKNYYTERIKITKNTCAIHHFQRSWAEKETMKQRILRKHRIFNRLYYLPHRIGKKILKEKYDEMKRLIRR